MKKILSVFIFLLGLSICIQAQVKKENKIIIKDSAVVKKKVVTEKYLFKLKRRMAVITFNPPIKYH